MAGTTNEFNQPSWMNPFYSTSTQLHNWHLVYTGQHETFDFDVKPTVNLNWHWCQKRILNVFWGLLDVSCQLSWAENLLSVVCWMSVVSCQLSVGVVASDPLQIASGLVMLWTSASVRRVSDFIWHLTCINWHPVCYKQQASPTGITNRQANWPQRLATTQSSEIHLDFVLSE